MRNQFVTIKDIARSLGVSIATVSRAMRDSYDVSSETRKKVLTLANKLNYRPNLHARGLVSSRSNNIGIILPFITNYYFSTAITGMQEVAWSAGYNIIIYVTNDSPERESTILKDLSYSSLDGLLVCISAHSSSSQLFQEVIDKGTPVVFFDRVQTEITTSKVMQDDYNGAFQAVEHMIKNGYKRIAHISGPKGFALTENRAKGYREALEKHNLPVDDRWIVHTGFSQSHGEEDTYSLFKSRKTPPDAIFAVNDRKAIGAMIALKKMRVKIGKEVGIVGFTNDPASGIISPGLSTIAEPAREIGAESCKLLIKHITKTNFSPREIVLPGQLIVRESSIKSPPSPAH